MKTRELTRVEVLQIYRSKETFRFLALAYGTSEAVIRRIKLRLSHTDVTGHLAPAYIHPADRDGRLST